MTPIASPIRDTQDQINGIVLGSKDIKKLNQRQICPNQVSSPVGWKTNPVSGSVDRDDTGMPRGFGSLMEGPLTHRNVLSLPLNCNHLYGYSGCLGWERKGRSTFNIFGRILRETGKRRP